MKIIDVEQGSKEWLNARLGVATASCFNKILTPKNLELSKSLESYAYEVVGERLSGEVGESFRSFYMKRGNILEDEACNEYAFMQDSEIQKTGFWLGDGYGCSPDRLVGDEGGLEVKCPILKTHHSYIGRGELPTLYRLQVLGCLLITKREWWDFVSYFPNSKLFIIRTYAEKEKDSLIKLESGLNYFNEVVEKLHGDMRQ